MEKNTEKNDIVVEESTIDWKDMYIRLYADMDNLKKRISKEKEEVSIATKAKMIDSILDMDNDLSIALKSFKEVPKGIDLIIHKLKHFLESQNIKEIETDKYDSDVHEVISLLETGEDKIIDVVSKGYRMGDKIIRYPKIILSK